MSSRRTSERIQRKQSSHLYTYFDDDDMSDEEYGETSKRVQKTPSRRSHRIQNQINFPLHQISSSTDESSNFRELRKRTSNVKYSDGFCTPTKSQISVASNSQASAESEVHSDKAYNKLQKNDENLDNFIKKSNTLQKSNLFENMSDIEGKQMYGFHTPKKRGSMALLVKSTPRTPKTPTSRLAALKLETPKTKSKKRIIDEIKTPHHIRTKLKEEISRRLNDSSESDFSADESNYEPSSEDDSEKSSSKTESDVEIENDRKISEKISKRIAPSTLKTPSSFTKNRKTRIKKAEDYVPECEEYFTANSKKAKNLTSDHTLDRLKNPKLPTDRLFSLLSSLKLSVNHDKAIKTLLDEYKTYFNKWMFILNEGYNIIVYGLGSKRNVLQTFHKEILSNQSVIVINGFFPSLTIKDVLNTITNDLLDLNLSVNNYNEIINIIENEFSYMPETHLFLIVHNIDGIMLRHSKSQEILSHLAKIPNIHLIASIDHINAPLLWDRTKLSNFNFSWWDCTTMLPYTDETAFENSFLIQNSGELALSSLRNVFQSLTTNAKGIYMIIVKHQLKNKENSNYAGIQFKDLYWNCREAFLVSSDLALRAQLTEFLDHKLIKSKRAIDGSEHLIIPIEGKLLQQFVNEQED